MISTPWVPKTKKYYWVLELLFVSNKDAKELSNLYDLSCLKLIK